MRCHRLTLGYRPERQVYLRDAVRDIIQLRRAIRGLDGTILELALAMGKAADVSPLEGFWQFCSEARVNALTDKFTIFALERGPNLAFLEMEPEPRDDEVFSWPAYEMEVVRWDLKSTL